MPKFNLDVHCNNDYACIRSPDDEDFGAHVAVELTHEDIQQIKMMQRLCQENNLAYIYTWDYSPDWFSLLHNDEELRWDLGMQIVCPLCVRWKCNIKHTDIPIHTESLKIDDLKWRK